ncbi:MAG: cob(I)yrinic acid a,c-diamide adenosyltransferase [Prevotella sp.]|nr:cob(I)yrinic acid a,c-diamide adenosyltransferase [Prevotella sp.]
MTIYTRHGDKAFTTTFDGERTEKTSPTIAAYGDIDELTAHLGLLRAMTTELQKSADNATDRDTIGQENQYIEHLQRHLLAVGWCLMSTHPSDIDFAALTTEMERRIDTIDTTLPPLQTFVVPGNTMAEAQCHVCRTVCRRAERAVAEVARQKAINQQILPFMNRLSDYLFVLARNLNFISHHTEKTWNKTCR